MVCDSEDAIKAVGERELDDEIHRDSFEGEGSAVSRDGAVRNAGARGSSLSGLTGGATANEGGDEGLHVGPPIVFGDKEAGFEDAGVTRSRGIVVQGGHPSSKGVVCHDDEAGAIPPGAVGALLQRVGVGPLGEEGGVGGLGGEEGGVKVGGGHGTKK